jgi:hypothetical protein
MASRLLFFSLDGAMKRSVATWKQGRPVRALVDPEGKIVAEIIIAGEKKGVALMKFNPDFEQPSTLAFKEREKLPLLEDIAPRLVWSVSRQGDIVWGDSEKYELHMLDRKGKLICKLTREGHPETIDASEYQEHLKRKFGGKPIPPVFEQELPKYYPAFRFLAIDDQGRLFVSTYEKANNGQDLILDVFDSNLRYIARVPVPAQPRVFNNGKLYTAEDDEQGYPLVKRYRLQWKTN